MIKMQTNMKRIKYLLLGAALVIGFGCTNVFDDYTPGSPDDADNYGVYFPAQATTTSLELEPGNNTDATYKVRRKRTDGAITVPVRIEVWTLVTDAETNKSEYVAVENQRIFSVSPISFNDGERDTEFKIEFPRAELGVEYKATLTIDDPAYVSTYNGNDTSLTISVMRASWNHLGTGYWRDDILSSIYVSVPNAYAEMPVEIYEREDQPGIYRMKVFNKAYVYALFDGMPYESDESNMTIVNASDPEKVWLPLQNTGLSLASDHGNVIIASNVDKIFSMDASDSQYGTLNEGIITFPVHGMLARLTGIDGDNEWRSVNSGGMLRLRLPGSRLYDYSFEMERRDSSDGAIGFDLTYAEDVALLKYGVVEGRLDESQASLTAQSFDTGEIEYNGQFTTEKTRLTLNPAATGIYTLICCSYDKNGQMQDYRYQSFGYVARGEERPVVATFGLELTNEQAALGYDKTNSLKFYLFGSDIYSVRYALRRNDKTGKDMSDEDIVEQYGYTMSSQELEKVNNSGYGYLFTGLNGNCEYTLYLQVDNGYTSRIFKEKVKTEGKYNPLLDGWSYNDFRNVNIPLYKNTVLSTNYNLYGFDLLDAGGRMKFLGEVKIFDEDDSYADDIINIRGMMSDIMIDDGKGEDEHHRRHLVPATDKMLPAAYDLYSEYGAAKYGIFAIGCMDMNYQNNGSQYEEPIYLVYYAEETLAGYVGNGAYTLYGMTAGEVADGCLAITPNYGFANMNVTYRFMGFLGQKSTFALYMNLILVDKSKDLGLPENAPLLSDIMNMTYESEENNGSGSMPWSVPSNYVEFGPDITPYTRSIMYLMSAHNRNIFVYPGRPAQPASVKRALVDAVAGEKEDTGTGAEMPARPMSLKGGNKVIRLNN